MGRGLPILVVEDDAALREAVCDTLELAGQPVLAAGGGDEALQVLAGSEVALVVSDVRMLPMDGITLLKEIRSRLPQLPVVLMTAFADVDRAVEAMRAGACDFLLKPFEPQALLEHVLRYRLPEKIDEQGVIAVDAVSKNLFALARRVAQTDATVLLSGESGVGKEVVARHIHQCSARCAGPFVAINCAAIPDSLLEATLFGHEKGAFSGAHSSQAGKFEQAQNGTLLLDEITEMPLPLQAKLLRVLQEREVERVGGRKPVSLDIRIIATSNRDIADAVASGHFREDLFYRLNVFPLLIPALRQRIGDIVPLARHFLATHGARAMRRQEMPRERHDVADTLAQGGNQQRKHVQPVEQILTKMATGDRVGDVPIGGGDDADVERYRLPAADPLHLALLQDPQQLGLQRQRHLGDLVEQERAILRLLELAGLRTVRTAEGSLLVPEERRFEQAVGNRRTVDGDERARAARRALVDMARHDLLADTTLATQQHRRIGLCHTPGEREKVFRHGVDGDHALLVDLLRQTVAQYVLEQRLWLERLEEEIAGTGPHRLDCPIDVGKGRHQDDRQLRQATADFLQQRDAIHRQHAHVTDDERDLAAGQYLQRLIATAGGENGLSGEFEGVAYRLAQRGIVLDDEDWQSPAHRFHSPQPSRCVVDSSGSRSTNSDP